VRTCGDTWTVQIMFDNARLQVVRASARLCAVSLGTRAVVLDTSFHPVESFPSDEPSPICDLVNTVPDAAVLCLTARKRGARRAVQFDGAYFFGCHADLVEGTVPVRENGVISGYLAIGPVFLAPGDPWLIEKIVDHLSVYSIPEDAVRDHLKRVPVIEPDRFKRALRQLAELVTIPLLQSDTVISEQRDTDTEQEETAATVPVKERRRYLHHAVSKNSSAIERFIIGHVRLGNFSDARHAIGELITSRIQPRAKMQPARLAALEVVSGLWRTAMEMCGSDVRFTARNLAVSELSDARTVDEILDWATRVIRPVARSADAIPKEKTRTLKEARKFVRRSLAERLCIADVAHTVGTEPDQLERMFQRYLGMSFRTYLALERLSVARKLLRESNLTASEIAARTGFRDQSNFTKTFEKYQRNTPIKYRRRQEK